MSSKDSKDHPFKEDLLKNEKNEPVESSSLTFINVPLVLLALFIGFGVSYLALLTDQISMETGDNYTEIELRSSEKTNQKTAEALDPAQLMARGKQIYTTTCQACHQESGTGIAGAFPPLNESEWVNGSPARLAAIILHGVMGEITVNGQKFNSAMPPFKDQLSADDIAAVMTYIRQSFGNSSGPVESGLVQKVLDETKSKASSWNGEAELNANTWE